MFSKCWWMSVGVICSVWRTSITPLFSHALPCQMPFCHTAPLLPSVAWQQNVTEYSWEGSTFTAVTPTFISDVMGQYNKVGGITFRAALVYLISMYICASMKHGSDRCKIFVSVLWAKGRRLSLSKYTMVKECLNTKKHERECWSFHLCTCQ